MIVDLWRDPGPFTTAELASALRCSPRYLEKLAKCDPELPVGRLGRRLRWPASLARKLAVEAGVEPPSPELLGDIRAVRQSVPSFAKPRDIRMDERTR